ncbi:MAG: ATP-binding protein [Chitinophagaceae bacterium]
MATIAIIFYLYQKKRILFNEHLSQALLEIQEETFQNISREIHDNIGLSLTLVKLHLNSLNLNTAKNTSITVASSIELISQAIIDLSDISKGLNSDAICSHGLLNVLQIKLDKLKKSGRFAIGLEIDGQPIFMNSQKELLLYRIFQEALNNIIKHAKANSITVYLNYTVTFIQLKIKDDGIGINYEEIEKAKSIKIMTGLSNIKKRTKMLNGTCNIISDSSGTTICITVPLEKNEK